MDKAVEIVTINLNPSDRMRLDQQINDQMEKQSYGHHQYNKLGLGFELPTNWPADINCEVTLAQLVVVGVKLNMQIEIADLNMGRWHR
jgi:hypothetical protein